MTYEELVAENTRLRAENALNEQAAAMHLRNYELMRDAVNAMSKIGEAARAWYEARYDNAFTFRAKEIADLTTAVANYEESMKVVPPALDGEPDRTVGRVSALAGDQRDIDPCESYCTRPYYVEKLAERDATIAQLRAELAQSETRLEQYQFVVRDAEKLRAENEKAAKDLQSFSAALDTAKHWWKEFGKQNTELRAELDGLHVEVRAYLRLLNRKDALVATKNAALIAAADALSQAHAKPLPPQHGCRLCQAEDRARAAATEGQRTTPKGGV